ncbi:hypothetical protein [Streptomyces sp. NPDC059783]|uniref:hypothetical protein n=1 Tax=Streptomyces sp. NPDC059783 TaxID=3346944 RepID=UPI00365EA4F1
MEPDVAQTAAMLMRDIRQLRVAVGRGKWTPGVGEGAHHRIHSTVGPWLELARSRCDGSDSPADRARWNSWISALALPAPSDIKTDSANICVLAGTARAMLRGLLETLPPCPSVGWVADQIDWMIQAGQLAPAVRISPGALERQLQVPREHIDLALTDLDARGQVEIRATGRVFVAVPGTDAS